MVENERVIAELNLASGFKMFLDFVASQDFFLDLIESSFNPECAKVLSERIRTLVKSPHNKEFEHPWDTPVAIYLYALQAVDYDAAREVSEFIAPSFENLWWAEKVAKFIIMNNKSVAT